MKSFGAVVLIAFIAYLFVTPSGGQLWKLATTPAAGWGGFFTTVDAQVESLVSDLVP